MPKKRRIWALVVGIIGLVLVAGSFLWRSVAVDKLVKLPDDIDDTAIYEGTVTLLVDPATAAPLAEPKEFPLRIERNIKSVAGEYDDDTGVILETLNIRAEGLFETTQQNQYVMDRSTMVNVEDQRAWAYEASNVVNRAGSWRLFFPMDNKQQEYTVYENEAETTYTAKPEVDHEPTINGLDVNSYIADTGFMKITETYLAQLDSALPTPLPRELGLTELAPLLKSRGIDLQALLPALLPALSEADRATVLELANQKVPLVYMLKSTGNDSANVQTGAVVQVHDVNQVLAASPDPAALPPLVELLGRYTEVPGISDALANLQKLANEPIPLMQYSYSQTDASVDEVSDTIGDNVDKINLAESTIPTALLWSGVALALVGFGIFLFWRKPAKHAAPPAAPASPPEGPEPVSTAVSAPAAVVTDGPVAATGPEGSPPAEGG